MMTVYELGRRLTVPLFPVLHSLASSDLHRLVETSEVSVPQLLDVGGRNSPYTVGLPAEVTVLDLPRQSEVQEALHLGVTDGMLQRLRRRRSNIRQVVLEDMCKCTLADSSFDGVVAVETIEHVEDDDEFVRQAARVIKPGGWMYLTTPNGDYIKNEPPNFNPDHLRHYGQAELSALLARHFAEVHVRYAVRTGRHRRRGLQSWSLRRPLQTVGSALSNALNHLESRGVDDEARRTAHLVAWARKSVGQLE